jgi:NTP pyrophosphatase (non-canonical NTP hydrolase)
MQQEDTEKPFDPAMLETMTLKEWSIKSTSFAAYPQAGQSPHYPMLGLIGEIGEVCEHVKKILRGDGQVTSAFREKMAARSALRGQDDELDGPYDASLHKAALECLGARVDALALELGDALWYINQVCYEFSVALAHSSPEVGFQPIFYQAFLTQAKLLSPSQMGDVANMPLPQIGDQWAGDAVKMLETNHASVFFIPIVTSNHGCVSMCSDILLDMVGSASSLPSLVRHVTLHDARVSSSRYLEELVAAIANVLGCVLVIGAHLGYSPGTLMAMNYKKLASRQKRGVILGSGSDR